MVVSGGYMRKSSARVGTAAYWIEVFAEQAEREAARRREAPPPAPPGEPAPPEPGNAP
jgi:hypothetical protein